MLPSLAMRTSQWAWRITFSDTLPSTNCPSRPRPWDPTTIRSAFQDSARTRIPRAGLSSSASTEIYQGEHKHCGPRGQSRPVKTSQGYGRHDFYAGALRPGPGGGRRHGPVGSGTAVHRHNDPKRSAGIGADPVDAQVGNGMMGQAWTSCQSHVNQAAELPKWQAGGSRAYPPRPWFFQGAFGIKLACYLTAEIRQKGSSNSWRTLIS